MKNFEEEDGVILIWEVEGWGVIERSGIGARPVSPPAPKVLLMSRLLFLNTSFSLPAPDVEDDALGVDPTVWMAWRTSLMMRMRGRMKRPLATGVVQALGSPPEVLWTTCPGVGYGPW